MEDKKVIGFSIYLDPPIIEKEEYASERTKRRYNVALWVK